jgi:hypothetical protein
LRETVLGLANTLALQNNDINLAVLDIIIKGGSEFIYVEDIKSF